MNMQTNWEASDFGYIDVFQDLVITPISGNRLRLRESLLQATKAPWRHDTERESRSFGAVLTEEESMLALAHDSDDEDTAALLILWPDSGGGYKVTNIVPTKTHELSILKYNAILRNFVEQVVNPAKTICDTNLDLTKGRQNLLDWTSREAAEALLRFSQLANKSTGAGHPLDRKRWMIFVIEQHRHDFQGLDPSRLARWLVEAEQWQEEKAHDLAVDYETALELLHFYDQYQ